MKKIKMAFCLLFVLSMALNVSCAGSAEAADSGTAAFGDMLAAIENSAAVQASAQGEVKVLGDVEGKEWSLTELRSGGSTVRIDRSKLGGADTNGSFTIIFQEGRVNGVAWPNRYFGPYTSGAGDALTISDQLASTMMAAFIELDELKEHEYFAYLSKVTRWTVRDGKLELYSTVDGRETVLVFELS
jgi:heat shock protein HslJ